MLTTQRGSPDGVSLHLYEIDMEYDLSASPREEDLAQAFVREGWAMSATVPRELIERHDRGEAPDNKAIPFAPENKGRRRR